MAAEASVEPFGIILPKPSQLLIYGANGYTGELIAREAVLRGLRPVLAGRSAVKIATLANELDLEQRIFSLDDASRDAIDRALTDVSVVLHCAGPFSRTALPMVNACLRTQTHYLDITGEIPVFEMMSRLGHKAARAGVMLLPGSGFDVVPTDCLAAHLYRRMPDAARLTLALLSLGGVSRGTAATAIEGMGQGGAIRSGGRITRVPPAKTAKFDFGRGPVPATQFPWGDISTAFHSTGIPNIEVYVALPSAVRRMMSIARYFGTAVRSPLAQGFLKRITSSMPPGPSPAQRERGASIVVGQVEDSRGNKMISRLCGPEGYKLTVLTALAIAQKTLAGNWKIGFQTPSLAYGADLIKEIAAVTREDVE